MTRNTEQKKRIETQLHKKYMRKGMDLESAHFCSDSDYTLVDKNMIEWEYCKCKIKNK